MDIGLEETESVLGGLTIWRCVHPSLYAIRVEGELDVASAALLEEELAAAVASASERLLLDLGALAFIDSTGIRLLLEAQARSEHDGDRLSFSRPTGAVLRTVRMAGLEQLLRFVDWPPTTPQS